MVKPSKSTEIAVAPALREEMALVVTDIIKEKMAECIGEFNLARNDLVAHMERVKEDGHSLKDNIDDSKKLAERVLHEMHAKMKMARNAAVAVDDKFAFMEGLEKIRLVVEGNTAALLPRLQQIELDHAVVVKTYEEIKANHKMELERLAPPIFSSLGRIAEKRFFLMATFKEIPIIHASLAPLLGNDDFKIEETLIAEYDSDEDFTRFTGMQYRFTNFDIVLGYLDKIKSYYDGVLPFPVKVVLPCRHDIHEDHRHKHPDGRSFGINDTCQSHDDTCHAGCATCDKLLLIARKARGIDTPSE